MGAWEGFKTWGRDGGWDIEGDEEEEEEGPGEEVAGLAGFGWSAIALAAAGMGWDGMGWDVMHCMAEGGNRPTLPIGEKNRIPALWEEGGGEKSLRRYENQNQKLRHSSSTGSRPKRKGREPTRGGRWPYTGQPGTLDDGRYARTMSPSQPILDRSSSLPLPLPLPHHRAYDREGHGIFGPSVASLSLARPTESRGGGRWKTRQEPPFSIRRESREVPTYS